MSSYYGYFRTYLGKIKIIIDIDDSQSDSLEILSLLSIGNISIGDDNEKEFTFFPNKLSLSLHFGITETELVALSTNIFQNDTKISIYKDKFNNNNYAFPVIICNLDRQSLKINLLEKTIEMTGIDEIAYLKNIDPKTNPLSLDLTKAYRSTYLISSMLRLANVDTCIINNNLEGRLKIGADTFYIPFADWYTYGGLYFGASSHYDNLFALLRNILLNYAMQGFVNLERQFIARSWYSTEPTIKAITSNDIIGDYQYLVKDNTNVIKVKLNTGGNSFSTIVVDRSIKEKIEEELIIIQTCGWFNNYSQSWSGVYGLYNSALHVIDPFIQGGMKYGPIRMKIDSTTYSLIYDLWYYSYLLLTGKNLEYLNGVKYQIEIRVKGLDYNPAEYYTLPFFDNLLFRANKIEYDIINGFTKLFLRSAFIADDLLTIDPTAIPSEPEIEEPPDELSFTEPYTPGEPVSNTPGYDDGVRIVNEIISLSASEYTYRVLNTFISGSTELFRNGSKQTKDVDYTEDNNQEITLLFDFETTEIIQINYNKL